jgi:hypothetical protein
MWWGLGGGGMVYRLYITFTACVIWEGLGLFYYLLFAKMKIKL